VAAPVRKARGEELRAISEEKSRVFRRRFLGASVRALALSDEEPGCRIGLTGNYLRVRLPLEIPANTFAEGVIIGESGRDLLMTPVAACT
jgi:hypothetical protein